MHDSLLGGDKGIPLKRIPRFFLSDLLIDLMIDLLEAR